MTKLECSTLLRRNWIDAKYWTPNSGLVIDWTWVIDETQIGSPIRVSFRLSCSTIHWPAMGNSFGSYSEPGTRNSYQAETSSMVRDDDVATSELRRRRSEGVGSHIITQFLYTLAKESKYTCTITAMAKCTILVILNQLSEKHSLTIKNALWLRFPRF